MLYRIVLLFSSLFFFTSLSAQEIDLLIKGGHLIDPKNGIDEIMDVAIKAGKVYQVAKSISPDLAKQVIDAKGKFVTPGLIDIHGHHFWGTEPDAYLSNSFSALPPDGFCLPAGVTTVVDAGDAGWRNFRIFKEQTIDRSKTRVLAFLNIVGSGMKGGVHEQDLSDMDAKLTAMTAMRYKNDIVGIKLAHYTGPEWTPTEKAVEAGKQANIPVMIDFGGHEPVLPLKTLLLDKLRPGDILTHCFAHVKGREPVVDENGKLRPFVREAQNKGIIFDVGHGGGSFLYAQAIPALQQGFKPNSISTDLHTGSMNGGMKSMLNVMSKFLNMGMSIAEIIERSSWNPAQIIKRPELGNLSVGAVADLAILSIATGQFGFVDTQGLRMEGTQNIVGELTLRAGSVVWDLNGISRPLWKP